MSEFDRLGPQAANPITELLRQEAEECRKSAVGNGEYNTAFWVAGIVLDNLARRLEEAL